MPAAMSLHKPGALRNLRLAPIRHEWAAKAFLGCTGGSQSPKELLHETLADAAAGRGDRFLVCNGAHGIEGAATMTSDASGRKKWDAPGFPETFTKSIQHAIQKHEDLPSGMCFVADDDEPTTDWRLRLEKLKQVCFGRPEKAPAQGMRAGDTPASQQIISGASPSIQRD